MLYKSLLYVGMPVLLALSGCTKNFEDINKNPFGSVDTDLNPDFALTAAQLQQAQRSIYLFQPVDLFQLQQNLNGDVFSGYMMSPNPFSSGNNLNYALIDSWNSAPFDVAYTNVMNPTTKAAAYSKERIKDIYAMSKIIRVEAMHRVSDLYGPIIYTKYDQPTPENGIEYDSQRDAYYAFFADLKEAIDILTTIYTQPASDVFKRADLVYEGSYKQWLQFANTLRLRLAIRIAIADPDKARAEGEAALANAAGLLSAANDNFQVNIGTTTHPLNTISASWTDIRMGAPMESILGGYADPRISKYFLPAQDPVVAGQYKGIRNGVDLDAKIRYENYSVLAELPSRLLLMTAAEAWFLKAEAAIRGWAGAGDAMLNYNTGIQTSFNQYGLGDAAGYYNDNKRVPKPYIDPKSVIARANDVPAGDPHLSTVTIRWEQGDVFERKLERIITQKWIAMFPEGEEAWAEFRRTGYPKLFPVVLNKSQGAIREGDFISRLNFSVNEYAANRAALLRAVNVLGGPDNGGTKLWWNK